MSGTFTRTESWTLWGRYFGFPECCVKSFLTMEHVGGLDRKLWGTGYIPCLKCNEKSEDELVETINSTRKSRLPFPNEEDWEIAEAHLTSMIKELM